MAALTIACMSLRLLARQHLPLLLAGMLNIWLLLVAAVALHGKDAAAAAAAGCLTVQLR
jgi:hypothetical protein